MASEKVRLRRPKSKSIPNAVSVGRVVSAVNVDTCNALPSVTASTSPPLVSSITLARIVR